MNRFLQLESDLKELSSVIEKRSKAKFFGNSLSSKWMASSYNFDWCAIKHNIVRIAIEEEEDIWTMADGITKRKENQRDMLPELEKYWRDGVKSSEWKADGKASQSNKAWSAAFICWVMREAGIKPEHGFRYGGRHMNYIVEAMRNREGEKTGIDKFKDKAFWLYSISEQSSTKIGVGDLICYNRKNSTNGRMSNYSYNGLKKQYFDGAKYNRKDTYGVSHCDIVVSKSKRGGKTYISTIGGNKGMIGGGSRGWTVNAVDLELDNAGNIVNPTGDNIFGFIKFRKCPDYEKGTS